VFLRQGFEATGAVRLLGAKIGGDLTCVGGKFLGKDKDGDAIIADGLTTTGSVFLSDGFEAAGAVRLVGANIGGILSCLGGKFLGETSAFNLHKGCVTGVFFWKMAEGDRPTGTVDLSSAEVGDLCDDLESWPEGRVILDGFRYLRISGAPTSYAMRKDWLERQPDSHRKVDFRPQPFEHLAQVLREMGHTEDAKRVAILKQRYARGAAWLQAYPEIAMFSEFRRTAIKKDDIARADAKLRHFRKQRWMQPPKLIGALFRWGLSVSFEWAVGFGYRPSRAIFWAAFIIGFGAIQFDGARDATAIVPNNPSLLKTEWANALDGNAVKQGPSGFEVTDTDCGDPYACFYKSVPDFQPFNPLVYSIDTFVPIVILYQESNWIPHPEGKDGAWRWTRLYLWFHILAGWVFTTLFAASFTTLVKKDV
ncbi:MAG: hypothetical protein ACU0B1_10240, partial [Thermohalobaculum sp.]